MVWLQATGCQMELSAEQVDAGEVDKLVQGIVQCANEVACLVTPSVGMWCKCLTQSRLLLGRSLSNSSQDGSSSLVDCVWHSE